MVARLIDQIAQQRPAEVDALLRLLNLVAAVEPYKAFVHAHLNSQPHYDKRIPLLDMGHFLGMDFIEMVRLCVPGKNPGANLQAVTELLRRLLDWGLVIDNDLLTQGAGVAYTRYNWNTPYIAFFSLLNVMDNVLLGPSYIAQKYRKSTPAIYVKKGGDEFTGTGFLVAAGGSKSGRRAIVTAKHNVDPSEGVEVTGMSSPDGATYTPLQTDWVLHSKLDLALMPIACTGDPPPIYPIGDARVLARTISLGYPRIGTTKDTYLLAHGGELNAVVKTYQDEEHLIISNLVAPGNSGGPVLDESGLCVGLVVNSFETRHEGGVTSASAALPAREVNAFILPWCA